MASIPIRIITVSVITIQPWVEQTHIGWHIDFISKLISIYPIRYRRFHIQCTIIRHLIDTELIPMVANDVVSSWSFGNNTILIIAELDRSIELYSCRFFLPFHFYILSKIYSQLGRSCRVIILWQIECQFCSTTSWSKFLVCASRCISMQTGIEVQLFGSSSSCSAWWSDITTLVVVANGNFLQTIPPQWIYCCTYWSL